MEKLKSWLKQNKMETDAEPLPPRSDAERELAQSLANNTNENSSTAPSGSRNVAPLSTLNTNTGYSLNHAAPSFNNNLANTSIHNTHSQQVYQFSNAKDIHIGDTTYNMNASTSASLGLKEKYPKTTSIQAMMVSDIPLDHDIIDLIATHLGEGWRSVARSLGFSEGQLDQMIEDHHFKGVKEIIYQFLLDWSRNDETANLGKIITTLWRNGNRETVYIVKEYWKNQRRRGE